MEKLIGSIKSFINLSAGEIILIKSLFTEMQLEAGEERTMYFNKENEFASYYPSFLSRLPSDKYIQALEPTELFIITYENLQQLYEKVGEGQQFGRRAIELVFLSTMKQLDSFYKDKPAKRYQEFLLSYPDLAQRIPQYYIASYVGIKPQSLSRIRKRKA